MRNAIIDAFCAFQFVLGRPAQLYRFGLWPLIATIVLSVMLGSLSDVSMGSVASLPGNTDAALLAAYSLLIGVPASWFTAVFAVRWHRLVLTGEDRIFGLAGAFSQRVGRFFALICLLDFLLIATATGLWVPLMNLVLNVSPQFPGVQGLSDAVRLTAIAIGDFVPACGAYAFLLSQIALIFPSIAIDRPASWKMIWRLSKGRRTRNFLTVFIVLLTTTAALAFAITVVSILPDNPQTILMIDPLNLRVTQSIPPSMIDLSLYLGMTPRSAPSVIETALTVVFGAAIMILMVAVMAVALSRMYQSGAARVLPDGTTAGLPTQPSDAK